MEKTIKIKYDEIMDLLKIQKPIFKKYVQSIINLANQYAQGTRPKVVGQMSELMKEFDGSSFSDWEKWYQTKYPDAISKATAKICRILIYLDEAIGNIDEKIVYNWVKDLVITKTYLGFKFQEAILIKVSKLLKINYKMASKADEAKGIDGYLGDIPVSIKPDSYRQKKFLPETIEAKIIYYEKKKDGILIDLTELEDIIQFL